MIISIDYHLSPGKEITVMAKAYLPGQDTITRQEMNHLYSLYLARRIISQGDTGEHLSPAGTLQQDSSNLPGSENIFPQRGRAREEVHLTGHRAGTATPPASSARQHGRRPGRRAKLITVGGGRRLSLGSGSIIASLAAICPARAGRPSPVAQQTDSARPHTYTYTLHTYMGPHRRNGEGGRRLEEGSRLRRMWRNAER